MRLHCDIIYDNEITSTSGLNTREWLPPTNVSLQQGLVCHENNDEAVLAQ